MARPSINRRAIDFQTQQPASTNWQFFDKTVTKFKEIAFVCGAEMVAPIPRHHVGESRKNPGEGRLRKRLYMPSVDKSPAASTKGVVPVHRCLIEGASRKWRCEIDVISQRISTLFINRPIRGGQGGEVPVRNRSDKFAQGSGVRWTRNVIGMTCSTSPSWYQCTTFILNNGAMF
jgi:hypothetical protein